MNPQQEQKLKELIRTSFVLNDIERQEWLALLGLMNDKQVFELEKILSTHLPPAGPSASSVTLERKETPLKPAAGHILNMPKPVQPVFQTKPSLPTNAGSGHKMPSEPVNAFKGKLRAMLQEKELPAGQEPLELEGPEVIRPKPSVFSSSIKNNVPKPEPPVSTPMPVFNLPIPKKPQVPVAVPSPVKLVSEQVKLPSLEHSDARVKTEQLEPMPNNFMQSLEEIAQLSVGSWLKYQSMVQAKLIHYAATAGMHEVLFRLEKSPAFKTYIDTGLKLLSSPDKSFDKFVTEAGLGPRLYSKAQFEAFADMLRHIQAGK